MRRGDQGAPSPVSTACGGRHAMVDATVPGSGRVGSPPVRHGHRRARRGLPAEPGVQLGRSCPRVGRHVAAAGVVPPFDRLRRPRDGHPRDAGRRRLPAADCRRVPAGQRAARRAVHRGVRAALGVPREPAPAAQLHLERRPGREVGPAPWPPHPPRRVRGGLLHGARAPGRCVVGRSPGLQLCVGHRLPLPPFLQLLLLRLFRIQPDARFPPLHSYPPTFFYPRTLSHVQRQATTS